MSAPSIHPKDPLIGRDGPASFWRNARLAVAALFFLNGVLFANWVARIPAVQAELGLSHGILGAALLGLGLGALVAMPLAGWIAQRTSSARVCRWTAIGYCAALPFLALAPNALTLTLALFCFGAMHGALDVVMNAQAVEIEHHYDRPVMSSFHALFSVGGLVGSITGGLASAGGLSPIVHFLIASGVLVIAVTAFVLPHLLPGRRNAIGASHDSNTPHVSLTMQPRISRTIVILGVIAFCVMMGEGAMADWSAIFLQRDLGASEALAAAGYAAFSIAMALGRFSGDQLSMRLGPVKLVRGSGWLALLGLALVLLAREPFLALAGFIAIGAGFAIVVPQVFSAAGRAPGGVPETNLAAATTIGYLGFLLGPPVIGFVAEQIGLRGALAMLTLTNLALVLLAPTVGIRRRVSSAAQGSAPEQSSPCAAVPEA